MTDRNYALVKSEEHLTRFVDKLLGDGEVFAFDIETGYTGSMRAKRATQHYAPDYIVAGISFTNDPGWARYASVGHDDGPNLDKVHWSREMWRLLRSGKGIPHNALFELNGLARHFRDVLWDDETIIPGTADPNSDDPAKGWGISYKDEVRETEGIYPVFSDTMIESMLLGENKEKKLKTLTKVILGIDQAELISLFKARPDLRGQDAAGKLVKYNTTNLRFNVLPLDQDVVDYACEDSAVTIMHHRRTYPQVKDSLIFKTELRLQPVLIRMEKLGMYLDWEEYERRSVEVEQFRDKYAEYVMDQFSEIVGHLVNINLNSHPQVREILFGENEMALTPTEYTKGGASGVRLASTGEKALRTLVGKHPELKALLQYREIAKLLSSYINKYLNELRYDPTGFAHPSHKQEGAGTGRFSVDGVSYQQWPKPYHYELPDGTSLDLNYRNFLISPPDHRIIGFDYANVELRIVAGLAGERAMLEAFANGVDIHKQTASLMLKVALDDVTDKQRSVGKTLNFAIVYGSGADNIATLITAATGELCTVEQAEAYLEQYFKAFPDLKAWMDERVLEGREVRPTSVEGQAKHYITTAFGRRIPIFEYESQYKSERNKGDRNAVNGPVQGAAADYMKIAMVRADGAIRKAEKDGIIPKDSVRLVMTIHDALEFYVHKDVETKTVIDLLEPAVSYPVDQFIPNAPVIRADWHEGYRWGSVAEIEQGSDGNVLYHRKLELPDKSKHTFVSDSLDDLVSQIDKFWEERNGSSLSEKVLEELDFDYDPEDDEFYVPDNTNVRAPELTPHNWAPQIEEDLNLAEDPPAVIETEEEPVWLHSPGHERLHLNLTLDAMPTTITWPKFKEFLAAHHGDATLVVTLPQGEVTIENVGVLPEHEAELRLIFGGATLTVVETGDVLDKVMEGISL